MSQLPKSLPRFAILSVLYKTPFADVVYLKTQAESIGADFYSIDNSISKRGYAEGINLLLKKITKYYDYYVICNPDISFYAINVATLLAPANHFDVFGFAFVQNGTTYYGGTLDNKRLSGGLLTEVPKSGVSSQFYPVDFVSGSFMVIKSEVLAQIHGFDESYGMYYEDVDFCMQARLADFKVGNSSYILYQHNEHSDKTNLKKSAFLRRNRWRFFWKYANTSQKLAEVLRLPYTVFTEGLPWK